MCLKQYLKVLKFSSLRILTASCSTVLVTQPTRHGHQELLELVGGVRCLTSSSCTLDFP